MHTTCGEEINEQRHRNHNFEREGQRRGRFDSMDFFDSEAFDFKRLQFPVSLEFAMSINKSQEQSLSIYSINLENPCFSHGQLYVECSRVGIPTKLFIYTQKIKIKLLYIVKH